MNTESHPAYLILLSIMFLLIGFTIGFGIADDKPCETVNDFIMVEAPNLSLLPKEITYGVVSAYNSMIEQTDSTPCIGAGGYICGRDDVVANNGLPLGTWVQIEGKYYQVMDRMNARYSENHYDIFMDKDLQKAKEFGRQNLEVIIY